MSFRLLTNSTFRICRNLHFDLALPHTANSVLVGNPRHIHAGRPCNRASTGDVDANFAVVDVTERKRKRQPDADFRDFKRAYGSRSLWSIAKSLLIFRMCSFSWVLDNSSQVGFYVTLIRFRIYCISNAFLHSSVHLAHRGLKL